MSQASTEPFIVGSHLSKAYGLDQRAAKKALAQPDPFNAVAAAGGYLGAHDVSFSVAKGEVFAIMGLSGSGKSTVLRMINRLHTPSAGTLRIDGRDVAELDDAELRRLRNTTIGMVFQHFSLFPHRTVRENAAYGLKVRGVPRAERLERADACLERVGLADRGDRLPGELSGGMRQRVGLARALAIDPPVLLMDEPFSALDPLIRRDMQDLLLSLQQEDRRTTIFVTHDLNEAMRIGDQVMVMRQGRVVQQGNGVDIVANPADDYVREFVSDVDRTRVLTASDLVRPPLMTFSQHESPRAALDGLARNEVNAGYVLGDRARVLGIVTDGDLSSAIGSGVTDLRSIVSRDFHQVHPDDLVGTFMEHAGRHPVPVTVVGSDGRLVGVVTRAEILSALSGHSDASTTGTEGTVTS